MSRPRPKFNDFIGHRLLLEPIRHQQAGAMTLNEPQPHLLITGPSGVGKTHLTRALSVERGVKLHKVFGHTPRPELIDKLLHLEFADFFFIDEAHRLRALEQEMLYEVIDNLQVPPADEDSKHRVPAGQATTGATSEHQTESRCVKAFTMVVASDQPGRLLNAFRKRLQLLPLVPYSLDEMREITETVATRQKVLLTRQATGKIAHACHGLPRRAEQLIKRLRFHFPTGRQLGAPQVEQFLNDSHIDPNGLEEVERRYLAVLSRKRDCRASLNTLALALGTDPADVEMQIEPQLVRLELVDIDPGVGRVLTEKGKQRIMKEGVK
jgi:Holliday junction DNA helicase RuvB